MQKDILGIAASSGIAIAKAFRLEHPELTVEKIQITNPAILRLVKMVIDAAHREGKWAGMCGEMAGDEIAIPILLGLGLDEFSMSATSILSARNQILNLSKEEVARAIEQIINMETTGEVERFVKDTFLNSHISAK